jgi:hypothetical protein
MALDFTIPNTTPFVNYFGMATRLQSNTLGEVTTTLASDLDRCFVGAFYSEKVFFSATTDWWKNDLTRVTFKRYIAADTVVVKLYKDDVEMATLNDNTLGTFTDGFTSGNTEQQLYVSMLLDWKLVGTTYGWGNYQIKAELDVLGVTSEWESVPYLLMQYTDLRANGTTRLEWQMNGHINGSIFDYTGLDLYHSRRIKADLIEITPNLEVNKYKTSIDEWRQIQDKVVENYELRTKALPIEVTSNLVKEIILANSISITDYQIYAEEIYRRLDVYPDSIEKTFMEKNINSIYNVKFIAKKEKYIKRNN